jgi:alpha-1,6-mannosyltransferase
MPYDGSYHAPIGIGAMRRLLQELEPDVLQVSSPFIPAWVAASSSSCKLKTYVHHSDPIGSYVQPLAERWLPPSLRDLMTGPAWAYLRAVCRRFDATVVAGQWLEHELKQRGCQRVHTVPFGISHADFSAEKRDLALRARYLGRLADTPGAQLILIAGRLAVDKRQARLLRALLELSQHRPLGLVLLGDGPERAALARQGSALPAFTWLPFCKDRGEYATLLASADALLHGSVSETFGFVLAETLASGTPLVAPRAQGALALAEPEYAETYAAEAGTEAIAAALARLLERPREQLSKAARHKAETLPTLDDHFGSLFDLYSTLLAQQRHMPLWPSHHSL